MMALQLEVKMFELGTVAVNDVDGDFSWSGVHVEHMQVRVYEDWEVAGSFSWLVVGVTVCVATNHQVDVGLIQYRDKLLLYFESAVPGVGAWRNVH